MARTGNWYFIQSKAAEGAKERKAGDNFTPPAVDNLITSPKCTNGKYLYDGDVLKEVRFLTKPVAQFASGLVLSGLMERVKNKGGTAIHFPDYRIEMPMIPKAPGRGKRDSRMTMLDAGYSQNLTDQNVCVVRLVWDEKKRKKPTEEERLRELDDHVEAHKMKRKSKGKKKKSK